METILVDQDCKKGVMKGQDDVPCIAFSGRCVIEVAVRVSGVQTYKRYENMFLRQTRSN